LFSLFNNKAKKWIDGRKNIFSNIKNEVPQNSKIIWVHASSLGEFEQGRTLIEKIKDNYPQYKILLTFFSPSGYDVRKNYESADYIYYLPIDTPLNAKKFVEIVKPEMVFFIKYEYWYNYLKELNKLKTPVYYISTIFRNNQYFFKWYGKWFLAQLKKINKFFVQDINSQEILKKAGITNSIICGDTRFDRVFYVTQNKKSFPLIEKFCDGKKVILAGSSWPPDENILAEYIKSADPSVKFIITPHIVDDAHINEIQQKIGKSLLYSQLTNDSDFNSKILIIDYIGILLHLYQYATIAYIGGGFGKSIHNILEAATFGKPVVFGPHYQKFKEADDLIKLGGGFSINNIDQFTKIANKLLYNPEFLEKTSEICSSYVQNNIGGTEIIIKDIFK